MAAALATAPAWAATQNYTFTTATDASLADMSSGTTTLINASIDDAASPLAAIGFDFFFQGVRYTQYSINSNGVLRFDAAAPNSTPYQPLGVASRAVITAFGTDQQTHSTGRVHSRIVGSAPNRVLVIEWLNMQSRFAAMGTPDLTYQVHLSESTGAIDLVYGAMSMSTAAAASGDSNDPHIGFSSSNLVGTIGTVTAPYTGTPVPSYSGATNDPIENLYNTAGPIPVLNSAANGARRVFSFDPPTPANPGALSFTGTTTIATTLNWADAANELGYVIYRSTDGGASYAFLTTLAANAVSHNDTGLIPGSTYFYRVHAFSEGALSAASQNSVTTNAAGSIASTAAGGLWSQAATWIGGVVPTAGDNVTITDGATVTIDTAALANNLTVGTGGATANLVFEAATARTLTVTLNTSIASNGSFRSAASGTVTTHVLSTGNLTNNGVLDFSTNGNTAGAGISFAGGSDSTFGGSGPTTDLRDLTLNKSSRAVALHLQPAVLTVRGVATDSAGFATLTAGTLHIAGNFTAANRVFGAAGYSIGTTAALWLDNPNYTVAGQNGSPTLTGLLRVSNGTLNIGTAASNSLGFAPGATIVVEGGAINVAGRFGVAAANNTISYTQSGGTVTTCTIGNSSATLGCFDLGTGSANTIAISGGTMVVQLAGTGGAATQRDWRNNGGLTGGQNITGGTLQLGNAASGAAKTFLLSGVTPNLVISNLSAGHTASFQTPGSGFNNMTLDVLIHPGTTLNTNLSPFLFNGTTLTNNGTLTASAAGASFTFFRSGAPVLYTGTGVATAPVTSLAFQTDQGTTFDPASPGMVVSALRLFAGNVTNASEITVGSGGSSTAVVQIGDPATPSSPGTFDVTPTYNPGSGGLNLLYLRNTASRTTGAEIPASRSFARLTYDDTDPGHTLTIAGGDINLSTLLDLTNGRIVTGANRIVGGISMSTARSTGYVDGNLVKTFSAVNNRNFEVGTANGYSPVSLDVTAGTFPTDIAVRAIQGAPAGFTPAGSSINRHWSVTATGVTADVVFGYLDADIPGTVTESGMHLFRNSSGTFADVGGSINTTANTASLAGVSTFSLWTLGNPGAGQLSITPDPVDFGSVETGATGGPLSATLRNAGGVSINVTSIGAAASPFARVGGNCGTPPFALAAGATCTIDYTFSPVANGLSTAALPVASTGGNGNINLRGTGVPPGTGVLAVSPDPVAFGSVAVNTTSAVQFATLANTGTGSLTVNSFASASAPFARSGGSCGTTPFVIAASTSCTIGYTFTPTATGPASASLAVDGSTNDSSINLSGSGVQGALSVSGSPVNFGDVQVGSASSLSTVTLTNSGTGTLQISDLTAAAAPFARNGGSCSSTVPFSLAPAASCTLQYRFSPTATGVANQTLTVTNNGPANGSISLSGNGVQGTLSISGSPVAFGDVAVGSTSGAATVTLSNTGTAPLQVSALDAAAAPFARSGGNCSMTVPFTLAVGANCTLQYTFSPTASGAANQTLVVTSNGPANGSIALSGNGVQANLSITGSPVAFGDVAVGATSAAATVTLANTGSSSLQVTGLDAATAPFARSGGTCSGSLPFALAAGTGCTLLYTFAPSSAGAASQTLAVTTSTGSNGSIQLGGNGVQGTLSIAGSPVNFGDVVVGSTSSASTVTLSNTGTAALQVSALTAATAPFARSSGSCSGSLPFSLAVGASCTLQYTFTPSATGAANQTLTVTNDGPANGAIALSGNGVRGVLSVTGSPVNFGDVMVGSTSSASSVTLSNTGTAALQVSGLTAAAAPFARSGGTCSGSLPFSLAVGGSCTLQYTFTPSATGTANQTLTVTNDGPANGSIALSGNGVRGVLSVAGSPVAFGDIAVGATSSASTVTLSNTGTASLQISALTAATAPFARSGGSCSGSLPFSLAVGANCTLQYTFSPTASGAANQTLTVTNNGPTNGSIVLGGNGVQGTLSVAGSPVAFGDIAVGSTSSASTVTLSNTGTAPLQITALTAATEPFARSGGTCSGSLPFSLAVGANCTLQYTFSPTAAGAANQTLTITNNGPANGSIVLGGNGVQGTLSVGGTPANFGDVVVGTTSPNATITLTNSGASSLQITGLDAAAAPFARSGGSCSASTPFALGAGASCTLLYTFTPSATGAANQTLQITTDGASSGTIVLAGNGVRGALSVSGSPVAFGDVAVGSTSSAQTVTLSNTGTGPLQVSGLTAAAAPFARSGGSCSGSLPFSLAAGANCTLQYTFSPSATGAANQTLTVSNNGPANGSIALGGNGVQGALSVAGSPVAFGDVAVGSTSSAATVTLSNTGTATLQVSGLTAAAAPFARSGGSCSGSLPFSLAVGASCTLQYTFSPTATGAANQTLTVTGNGPANGSIALGGNGVQGSLDIDPALRDFGNVIVATSSSVAFVTLRNDGGAPIQVTALTLAAAPFVRTTDGTCGNALPISLAGGASCTLSYRFDPSALGLSEQAFTVTAGVPGDSTFTLRGTGVPASNLIFRNGFEGP